jgi:glutamine synthetase
MAKYDDRIDGCSGHLHQSLWSLDGERNLFWDAGAPHHATELLRSYIAGLAATLPELMALYAPNVNSYKRLVEGSWAPTNVTWGIENRTCALRAILSGESAARVENRTPGADVNAYLGFAASLAGGLYGIERGLPCPEPVAGDAYKSNEGPRLPRTLREAIELFESSEVAREYLGAAFVEHYAAMRRWECDQYDRAVTDWERRRYFEMT